MHCQSYCKQGRHPCPSPYACGSFNQGNGGACIDTDLPAPTRPAERSTQFIDEWVPDIWKAVGIVSTVIVISTTAGYVIHRYF